MVSDWTLVTVARLAMFLFSMFLIAVATRRPARLRLWTAMMFDALLVDRIRWAALASVLLILRRFRCRLLLALATLTKCMLLVRCVAVLVPSVFDRLCFSVFRLGTLRSSWVLSVLVFKMLALLVATRGPVICSALTIKVLLCLRVTVARLACLCSRSLSRVMLRVRLAVLFEMAMWWSFGVFAIVVLVARSFVTVGLVLARSDRCRLVCRLAVVSSTMLWVVVARCRVLMARLWTLTFRLLWCMSVATVVLFVSRWLSRLRFMVTLSLAILVLMLKLWSSMAQSLVIRVSVRLASGCLVRADRRDSRLQVVLSLFERATFDCSLLVSTALKMLKLCFFSANLVSLSVPLGARLNFALLSTAAFSVVRRFPLVRLSLLVVKWTRFRIFRRLLLLSRMSFDLLSASVLTWPLPRIRLLICFPSA